MNPFAFITSTIEQLGYVGLALLTFLEVVFPPIPSELILPFAGFVVSQGKLSFPVVVIASVLGALLGSLLIYTASRFVREAQLRRLLERHGKFIGITPDDLDRAMDWFRRRGGQTVLLGRVLPGVRSLISIPAGLLRMHIWPFILWTTLGSALWSIALIGAGYLLGQQYHAIEYVMGPLSWIILIAVLISLGWYVHRRRSRGL